MIIGSKGRLGRIAPNYGAANFSGAYNQSRDERLKERESAEEKSSVEEILRALYGAKEPEAESPEHGLWKSVMDNPIAGHELGVIKNQTDGFSLVNHGGTQYQQGPDGKLHAIPKTEDSGAFEMVEFNGEQYQKGPDGKLHAIPKDSNNEWKLVDHPQFGQVQMDADGRMWPVPKIPEKYEVVEFDGDQYQKAPDGKLIPIPKEKVKGPTQKELENESNYMGFRKQFENLTSISAEGKPLYQHINDRAIGMNKALGYMPGGEALQELQRGQGMDSDQQKLMTGVNAIVSTMLKSLSGTAASDKEFERIRSLAISPGDTPETLEAKMETLWAEGSRLAHVAGKEHPESWRIPNASATEAAIAPEPVTDNIDAVMNQLNPQTQETIPAPEDVQSAGVTDEEKQKLIAALPQIEKINPEKAARIKQLLGMGGGALDDIFAALGME